MLGKIARRISANHGCPWAINPSAQGSRQTIYIFLDAEKLMLKLLPEIIRLPFNWIKRFQLDSALRCSGAKDEICC